MNYFGPSAKRIPVENNLADNAKLNAEILTLKESNRLLEEKFMVSFLALQETICLSVDPFHQGFL